MVEITAKEKALQLYNDAYERWANELSHDKNKQTAKSIATYVCNELLDYTKQARFPMNSGYTFHEPYDYDEFLLDVKQEIEKL